MTDRRSSSRSGIHGGRIGPAALEPEPTVDELDQALGAYLSAGAARRLTQADALALVERALGCIRPHAPAESLDDLERVAVHEAAHALVARRNAQTGRGPGPSLLIIEGPRQGSTYFDDAPAEREARVEVLLAGAVAEVLAAGDVRGAADDLRRAGELVREAGDGVALVRRALARVEWLLRTSWGEVQRVADGLRRAASLRSAHVEALVDTAPVQSRGLDALDAGEFARLAVAAGEGEAVLAALDQHLRRIV